MRVRVRGRHTELFRQTMFVSHLHRFVIGVGSIALHADSREIRIRTPWLDRTWPWFGLVPVVTEAGVNVRSLTAHISDFQHIVLPKLPRHLQIPRLHVGI